MNAYIKFVFLTETGKEVNVTVPNVKPETSAAQASVAMDTLLLSKAIASNYGALTKKKAMYLYKVTETAFSVK